MDSIYYRYCRKTNSTGRGDGKIFETLKNLLPDSPIIKLINSIQKIKENL